MGGAGEGSAERRSYRSERRTQQAAATRRRILAAAEHAFLRAGYAGATLRGIATTAGVSLATVEQAFGTKANLLKRVTDAAIARDDEPAPVLERAWAASARAAADAEGVLRICAAALTAGQRRSARLVRVLLEAAEADHALRPLAEERLAQRWAMAEWLVDSLLLRSRLRPETDRAEAVDTVWLLMDPVVFSRLTETRGWTPERFERWFAAAVGRLLLSGDR